MNDHGATAKHLGILHVEDSEDDVLLVVRHLQREGYAPAVTRVSDAASMKAALERSEFDVVLSDFVMPGFSAPEALRTLRESEKDLPFIVVSGSIGEDVAVEAMRAGAQDYFPKDRIDRLAAAIERELREVRVRRERQAALEERRILEERLRLVVETMAAPVVLWSRELRCLWVSKAYADWLGRTEEEIVGRPIADVIGREALEAIRPHIDRVLAGEHVQYEDRLSVPGRGARWIHGRYTPTFGAGGVPDGWVAVLLDVSDRKAAEEAALEASRRKDEFLALLGHELRNPLAPIVTALELLKLRGEAERGVQGVIERQVHHLSRLVDDLLDLSRITRREVTLEKRSLELRSAVASAVETASPLLEQRRHQLDVDVPGEGLLVDGDYGRLAQVFANLLNNAARYTPPGGHLAIRARRAEDGGVTVQVIDDGRGIAPEMLPHIFETFVRAAHPGERRESGLGIGLSVVKSLVELHGGRVAAVSEGTGRGSVFTVWLPPPSRAVAPQHPAAPSPPPPVPARRSLRVLVVDDNVDAAEVISMYLSDMGYEVETAEDGPSALAALHRFVPDVALLDIGLPVMNGYELAERIRGQLGPRTPVFIAFTGYGQEHDRERSREAGFHAHLVKPVEPERLVHELSTVPRPDRSDPPAAAPN
jgi:PAS domain S-box-containing protein